MATNVYIDGLNFYYGAVKGTAYKWLDFAALVRLLLPQDSIGRIRYFTAIVKPRFPGDRAGERQNALVRAIATNPLIDIHLGHFRTDAKWKILADAKYPLRDLFRPPLEPEADALSLFADAQSRRTEPFGCVRVIIDEEKGSDVNLGAHLVYDATKGTCDKAVVISNDSDLAEPFQLARGEGVPVGLVNPHPGKPSKHLANVASFQIPFRRSVLPRCQLPKVITDSRGKKIHKPTQW
ncbi:MAG: NYN domain-containing protein [Actinobacteria bacterium]|nr:NYN domain-containing protein [Actinomycetota bacterium]